MLYSTTAYIDIWHPHALSFGNDLYLPLCTGLYIELVHNSEVMGPNFRPLSWQIVKFLLIVVISNVIYFFSKYTGA